MTRVTTHRGPLLAYYGKLAIATGVPFGLIMGVGAGIAHAWTAGWESGLEWGVLTALPAGGFFGVVMSTTLGTLAWMATGRKGASALEVHQQRVVVVQGTRSEVLESVAAALRSLPRASDLVSDKSACTAEACTAWSWKSFGEHVSARVESVDAGHHRVHIESRPRLRTTLVDYGANAANVDGVVAALTTPGR